MATHIVCDRCGATHGAIDGNLKEDAVDRVIKVTKMRLNDSMYDLCNRCQNRIMDGIRLMAGTKATGSTYRATVI